MDSNETFCILLQHLQSDPGSLTERSTIDLILKSLRWLGLGVAAINNQRVDKKLFSLVILTQLAKHSDTIQNESKVLGRG